MIPFNPFLRGFLQSNLKTLCGGVGNCILLVPTSDVLLNSRDADSNCDYTDLCNNEDFLASHVIRISQSPALKVPVSPISFLESRTKAKQYQTANGRTLVIKDQNVYCNKGFKHLGQAQLLHDMIYYLDETNAEGLLVYLISQPLVGIVEKVRWPLASSGFGLSHDEAGGPHNSGLLAKKKDIRNFHTLMSHFPLIAKHMMPGLKRIFRILGMELRKRNTPSPTSTGSIQLQESSPESPTREAGSSSPNLSKRSPAVSRAGRFLEISEDENSMRQAMENAINSSIELFQTVDKTQLSILGEDTDLTGPTLERMIEQYVVEQVHDSTLFPQIWEIHKAQDSNLSLICRQISDVDVFQVGIPLRHVLHERKEISIRLLGAIEHLAKMNNANSPHQMLGILLDTMKIITNPHVETRASSGTGGESDYEKQENETLAINADTLVSLLVIAVARSNLKYLESRLSYMRHFIFVEDVDNGEIGYALSTFEGVLSYIANHSSGFRRSSKKNRKLWTAVRDGNIQLVEEMLGLAECTQSEQITSSTTETLAKSGLLQSPPVFPDPDLGTINSLNEDSPSIKEIFSDSLRLPSQGATQGDLKKDMGADAVESETARRTKQVSMNSGSVSPSSSRSLTLGATNPDSEISSPACDPETIEPQSLALIETPSGKSLLMIAVESRQANMFKFLLSLSTIFKPEKVLADATNSGVTLLNAALMTGDPVMIDLVLDVVTELAESTGSLTEYFSRPDDQGRSVAHYLFNRPRLIEKIGHLLPWTLRDKNGQTPLFALYRSYDHPDYKWMLNAGLAAAIRAQRDHQPLRLHEHMDGRGNTLLHVVHDSTLARKLLSIGDIDVNARNDKGYTPLMIASKFGRLDLVATLFDDLRVNIFARDLFGLTTVEIAKDDEVRNKIDDLVLLASPLCPEGRSVAVVRSYLMDGTVRVVVKSGVPSPDDPSVLLVTTTRRSFEDFENLAVWLLLENPYSWIPPVPEFIPPCLITSKPSRWILRDIQVRLDLFLRTLLEHPTFGIHETLWEFLLPEMVPSSLAERARRKAEARAERVREEYEPILDPGEVEVFILHAQDSIRSLIEPLRKVLRASNAYRLGISDLHDALAVFGSIAAQTLTFLPQSHSEAPYRLAPAIHPNCPGCPADDGGPLSMFIHHTKSSSTSQVALMRTLSRPLYIASSMSSARIAMERHSAEYLRRSTGQKQSRTDRWPMLFGDLVGEARARGAREAQEKALNAEERFLTLAKELRCAHEVVAEELAGWHEIRTRLWRAAIRRLAVGMLVSERERLGAIRRALRGIIEDRSDEDRRPDGSGEPRRRYPCGSRMDPTRSIRNTREDLIGAGRHGLSSG